MSEAIRRFIAGALAPYVGLLLIANHRSVLRVAVLPFLITLIVFVVGLSIGLPFITGLVAPFVRQFISIFRIDSSSQVGEALSWILPVLIWPALALALFYLLLNLTRLIAAPFYTLLAERVLVLKGIVPAQNKNLLKWALVSFRQTKAAVLKTAVFLVIGLILGLLSFVPGLGLFTGVSFLILLAYDIVDYALDVLEWPLNRRFEFFRQHFAVFLGLGLSLGLLFLVPGLGFFAVPAAVAGASDLVRRMTRE